VYRVWRDQRRQRGAARAESGAIVLGTAT